MSTTSKVHFVGGPSDGLEAELESKPPALWRVPIPGENGVSKCWEYYYNSENKTYYVKRGVHDA